MQTVTSNNTSSKLQTKTLSTPEGRNELDDELSKSFRKFREEIDNVTLTSPNCDHYGSNIWFGAFDE